MLSKGDYCTKMLSALHNQCAWNHSHSISNSEANRECVILQVRIKSINIGHFLVVPKFQPSVHKSSKQFGYSFAFDAPTLWNALPDDIWVYVAPRWPHSEEGSKHTSTTRHTRHTLHSVTQNITLSSVVHDPCYVPGHGY